ncbi:hypothetical protein TNCV_1886281 [Trichonephila clavipes]|nr:hypothetical protein TNCV_1886281 [Trichonephila clavipes]
MWEASRKEENGVLGIPLAHAHCRRVEGASMLLSIGWWYLAGVPEETLLSSTLPQTIKAGYLNCKIRPYIPNPLRCFKCQRFGHSQTSSRGQLTCSMCTPLPACPVLETTTTTSNTIPATSLDAKETSKPQRKNILLKTHLTP